MTTLPKISEMWSSEKLLNDVNDSARSLVNEAHEYIEKRQLSGEIVARFGIGYIDSIRDIFNVLRERNWPADRAIDVARDLRIIFESKHQKNQFGTLLGSRLTFPIHNVYGDLVAIAGRTLRDNVKPKYYNSAFPKGHHLYGLNFAWKSILNQNYVVIVEGYTDVIAAHKIGVSNIVSTMGTALTKRHGVVLSRYTQNAFLLFDADKAGTESTQRYMNKRAPHPLAINVQPRKLPKGFGDLDEMVRKAPKEACKFLTSTIIKGR